MTEDDIYRFLDERAIAYELVRHAAAFTVEEATALGLPHEQAAVKNLFLRDDKKRNWYLVTAPDNCQIDLKALGERIGSRRLQFASEGDLWDKLGLKKGSVTPLGLLNNNPPSVTAVFHESLVGGLVGVHPLVNTATVYLACVDLLELLRERGFDVVLVDL